MASIDYFIEVMGDLEMDCITREQALVTEPVSKYALHRHSEIIRCGL